MAGESKQVEFRCSNCDRVIATFPEGEYPEEPLVCPGCGATVQPPGVLKRLTHQIAEKLRGDEEEKPKG
jgi:hypothetical protein